mgnify:CR=1 FL=1|tara:strand:- start:177 stop:638 length:462 start_codon:yes stop_codon:yes gene_type:complete
MTDERIWDKSIKGLIWNNKECSDLDEWWKDHDLDKLDDTKAYKQDDFAHHTDIWKREKKLTLRVFLEWILVTHPFHDVMEGNLKGRVHKKGVLFMNEFMKKYPSKNGIPTVIKELGKKAYLQCIKHFALHSEEEKEVIKHIMIDEVLEYSKKL